ncbi:MAG: DEAD/DEAH box helicase [Phenylobacterium sp.]|uniref:DEAD/DEAH box helicase n=1 Tax=Phenylobacterium sp. TaxID=1871053 RepID=UPI001A3D98DA|nr:DEAD/DEAH box helicase [Phenylobacterium sp.]MBL8554597.1 DEAD/DEAH box helicase [Phenylobacterium sp.]
MIRAAFIGIDRYRDPQVGDLNGATRDARALWAVLTDSIAGIDARLLTDDGATFATVNQALDETLDAAGDDDVVLISFAGHGTPDHRLVVADTSATDIPNTTITMEDLAERFRRSRARAVVMLLDCCFSGGAPARVIDFGVLPRAIGKPLDDVAGEGRVLFAASAAHQPALEDHQTRHGLFTKAILDHLLTGEPVSITGMVDDVVRAVRANAGRMGYEQTPVMFGMVEGELSLPPCRRGVNYQAAFPEYAPIRTTGDFAELAGYGLATEVLDAWRGRYSGGLNALQIAAINDHNVLGGNSLLTVAPTSAGKTFIGEVAAIKAITEGRKAVFLLPYKALVNEKFEDFSALYGDQLNLRIARCSGDYQDQVRDVLRGKYDLAFFTYEKFLGMVLSAPHILNQIGLVVIDEAQFITEPGRGMTVELLLTYLLSARDRGIAPQVIALSAVIGDINGFERWLGCNLLVTDQRPVPLIEGVIDRTGAWTFRREGEAPQTDQLLDRFAIRQRKEKPSDQDVIVPLVRHLVEQGEKVIVFRNNRGSSSGAANYLAAELGLPRAANVITELPEADQSVMSRSLRQALEGGVAFHHGDLNREERVAVERGFRRQDGGIHVLVATSTVAAGVNTPASTVIVAETEFRGADGSTPYTVAQYKNMAGRAGRLGFENEGKAILIADNGAERNQLMRTYVDGRPEPLRSSFDERNPGTWVMRLLAQVREAPRAAVTDMVANTYGGYLANLRDPRFRERMTETLDRLLTRMVADGLVEQEGEMIRLTMLGRACGESPLMLESALRLVEVLRRVQPERATPETLATLLEVLPERDEDYTPQAGRYGEARWQQTAGQRFGFDVAGLLRMRVGSDKEYYARCKRALIVADWIAGVPLNEIEDGYSANGFSAVRHADVRGFADGSRYLLESAVRIASIVLALALDEEAVAAFLKRLELGVPEAALWFTDFGLELTRGELLLLWDRGFGTPDRVAAMTADQMEALIGSKGRRLHAALARRIAEAS